MADSRLQESDGSVEPDPVTAIFNAPPMPRRERAWQHVRWSVRHPYWALCFNVARLPRVRKYVRDSTSPRDLGPTFRRMMLVTSSHDALLDALWNVIPRKDGWPNVSPEFRGRCMSLVGSLDDSIYWVREREPGLWYAEEMEAGTGAWGYSEREALTRYWAGKFDKPEPPAEVFSRPECVWNYCPSPEGCQQGCVHAR